MKINRTLEAILYLKEGHVSGNEYEEICIETVKQFQTHAKCVMAAPYGSCKYGDVEGSLDRLAHGACVDSPATEPSVLGGSSTEGH